MHRSVVSTSILLSPQYSKYQPMNIKLHYCKAGRAHSPAGWWARYWWLLIIGSNNRRRPICIPMNIAISFTIYNMTTGPICIPIYIIVLVRHNHQKKNSGLLAELQKAYKLAQSICWPKK